MPDKNGRIQRILCKKDRLKRFGIYGAPDFVLEILSGSTRKKDMTVKLTKYMEAGVREYWVIDPEKRKGFRDSIRCRVMSVLIYVVASCK